MDVEVGIDFKEKVVWLGNYMCLGFSCEDIDFKKGGIGWIERMMEEVLDEDDVNLFEGLENVIEKVDEINRVDDVEGIWCEFYDVMDEKEGVMEGELFEKVKKYGERKIEGIVGLKEKEWIVMGNKYVELGRGKECVVESIMEMVSENEGIIKDGVLYVEDVGKRIGWCIDEFRKKLGVRK